MSRWATAMVALLLVPAMATSTVVSCLAAPATSPQVQMMCCVEQPDHCPMHRAGSQTAADCCRHDSHRQRDLTTAEVQPVHTPIVMLQPVALFATVFFAPPASDALCGTSHSSGSPPGAPSARSTVLLI